jgi:hypothetical protein
LREGAWGYAKCWLALGTWEAERGAGKSQRAQRSKVCSLLAALKTTAFAGEGPRQLAALLLRPALAST